MLSSHVAVSPSASAIPPTDSRNTSPYEKLENFSHFVDSKYGSMFFESAEGAISVTFKDGFHPQECMAENPPRKLYNVNSSLPQMEGYANLFMLAHLANCSAPREIKSLDNGMYLPTPPEITSKLMHNKVEDSPVPPEIKSHFMHNKVYPLSPEIKSHLVHVENLPAPLQSKSHSSSSRSSHSKMNVGSGDVPTKVARQPLKDNMRNTPALKRGNFPKQTTSFLKSWLMNNSHHPYPSEAEKSQMAEATGLTLRQVSDWMINARRRYLKDKKIIRRPM